MSAAPVTHARDLLDDARSLPESERAKLLDAALTERTTSVDPELVEALTDLRRWVERSEKIRYAGRYARRYGRSTAAGRCDALATTAQCNVESALEWVEALVCAGRAGR